MVEFEAEGVNLIVWELDLEQEAAKNRALWSCKA